MKHERQQTISEMLSRRENVRVAELARRFGVSEMTIRRDLDQLADRGVVIRTHGGGLPGEGLRYPPSLPTIMPPSPQKAAIGKLAASLVAAGQTIMVDAGTTAFEVVRNLKVRSDITIATVSLPVARELLGSDVNMVLIGGQVRKDFPSTYGPLTEKWLQDFRVDVLFMGCDAADSRDGFYLADPQLSSLMQAMISIADRIVLVADSSKFGRRAFIRFALPSQVNTLITDAGLSPEDRRSLEDEGVRVLTAEEAESNGQV